MKSKTQYVYPTIYIAPPGITCIIVELQMACFKSICFLTLVSLTIAPFALVSSESLSAYNILQIYGLPAGLLPEGVAGYDLNPNTGEFKAYLNRDCRFTIESRSIKYGPVIEGTISNGRLGNLEGVKVRVLFFWVGIKEIVREGDNIKITSGIASAEFPVQDFNSSPIC